MTIVLNKLQHSQIEQSSKTRLQAFQKKIYLKAKLNPKYKFYCLYDKVFRKDTLEQAYQRVKANRGTSGIDQITFKDLEGKEKEFIDEIQQELKQRTYSPNKLRKVEIPKPNGKIRTLQIPTIKDRVVQMAAKLIIEPIFEADFKDCSYGYRPKRDAHQAIAVLDKDLFRDVYRPESNRKRVKSIDLADCFGSIPHKELIAIIAKRIIDRQMLKLIKAMLRKGMMKQTREENRGTPQGGVISPLLANIYLNKIDEYWEQKGSKLSKMIRYADDIVVLLDKQEEQIYQDLIKHIEQDLKLTINREKSKTENIRDGVEYLGFRLKQKTSKRHKQYLSVEPSSKALKSIKEKIRAIVRKSTTESTASIIKRTNAVLKGWQQYFDNIAMGKTRNQINRYTELRLAKLITRRNKGKGIKWKLFSNGGLYNKYGLFKMSNLGRKFA